LRVQARVPADKQVVLDRLVGALSQVRGIEAIVLGGSYARGTSHDASDLDIGLYYYERAPFAVTEVRRVAEAVSARGEPVVTDFYEWGAWVNGGAWIHTAAGKVDFLYRNLDQVERTIAEAKEGTIRHDYPQQPPYGFYSVIYLAETHICVPLFDPHERIAELKRLVATYPPKLKEKTVGDFLWSAEFTLLHARSFAAAGDVYNTAGCLTRVASNLTQVLFALNERYFISDKKAVEELSGFPLLPPGYVVKLCGILAHPGETPQELGQAVADLQAVWQSVVARTGGTYRPKFRL
jgi:predicted nucleotidyltransferase